MIKPVIKASYDLLGISGTFESILRGEEELTLEDMSDTAKLALIHIIQVGGEHIAENWGKHGSFKTETETTIYDIALITDDIDFDDEFDQLHKTKGA